MRRLHLLPLALVAACIVAAVIVLDPLSRLADNGDAELSVVRERTEIAVATLSTVNEADGTLGFAEVRPVTSGAAGTLTSIAPVGASVEPGAVLFAIDDEPTVAFPGPIPAWRGLTVDDVGPDVEQLEAALVDLGYDPDDQLTVDDTYTTVTAAAVERWQEDAGLEVTGSAAFESLAFVPDGALVSSLSSSVGQPVTPGSTVLSVSASERMLSATIAADQRSTIELEDTVLVRLPDRSTVEASVIDFVAAGEGAWTLTGELTEAEAMLPDGASVPVTVSWTHVVAEDTTTIRASALTRLDTGAYVLEVAGDDGTTRFVEVEIGETSGSTVEIITELSPGTTVISS